MSPDALIFDLDGTLWDTTAACAIAWNNVVDREGIEFRRITANDVRIVTGKPHVDCIRLTFAELPEAVIDKISEATMVEDNAVINEIGGKLYEGVLDGISALSRRYRLFIVSNCQSGYIETFLRLNGLEEFFEDIECWGNTGQSKDKNLAEIIRRNKLVNPVMIGDADGDEAAARACGIPFGFAEYGFGSSLAPEFRFSHFGEIVNHFG